MHVRTLLLRWKSHHVRSLSAHFAQQYGSDKKAIEVKTLESSHLYLTKTLIVDTAQKILKAWVAPAEVERAYSETGAMCEILCVIDLPRWMLRIVSSIIYLEGTALAIFNKTFNLMKKGRNGFAK